MKYTVQSNFSHDYQPKIGVLVTNLGTPTAPNTRALRSYLGQFLADPRVVEAPRWLWRFILHGVILRIRPKRSARAYRGVWTDDGSPLMVHTQAQCHALAQRLAQVYGETVMVKFAMRYGEPAIDKVIDTMLALGVNKLLVLPLYPQYCAATTGSTFDALAADFTRRRWLPELRFINHYHDFPNYIDALATTVKMHWQQYGRADKLVMSYHGIPLRYLHKGDPYHCECHKTSRLLAERLELQENEYLTTFQSRFGREQWLQPYTDDTLKKLPSIGVKSVQLICPGFAADCLETIEEIDVENRQYFLAHGGERFDYIPALNAQTVHIEMLAALVQKNLQGWETAAIDSTQTKRLAEKLGAKQ
jgi:protoporphyrin/coproporphyrin ferrochelatase